MPVLGLLLLAVYLCAGVACVDWLLPRHRALTRVWLGLCLGLLLLMWLPALCAHLLKFSLAAHLVSLIPLAGITGCCFLARDRREKRAFDAEERRFLIPLVLVCVPLTVLGGYLQYTHTLRSDKMGNLYVGQSTYGDLPMHLSFITGLKNAAFPPEYPFFPGHQLSYPYLTDTLSTTFYLFDFSLQLSVILPGTLMMALCYLGVMLLGREMTSSPRAAALAALLFFLNGGLGFLYDFDLAAGYDESGRLNVLNRLAYILEGYYKTPTNQPDPHNLRWSNLIADLLIPQRTLLGGYCLVIPCFYLLYMAFDPRKRGEGGGLRPVILLGLWAGALPLVHTHSFLALGLCSAGMLIYDLWHEGRWLKPALKPAAALSALALPVSLALLGLYFPQGGWMNAVVIVSLMALILSVLGLACSIALGYRLPEGALVGHYLVYAGLALLLAAPQLMLSTFRQTFQEGSSHSFLTLQFNWVNHRGGSRGGAGMWDFYLWFYLKNIGLPFAALILAAFERRPAWRRILSGAALMVLAAELIRFQPNEYDNNKVLYLAWMLSAMVAADWMRGLWQRLKNLRARPVIAGAAAVVIFLSAGLTLWRECVSRYQAFSRSQAAVAEWVKENTGEDARFISNPDNHLNPVSALAGRQTVCAGAGLWLYWHGFDTAETSADIQAFYLNPSERQDVLDKYSVDYILLSGSERSKYGMYEEDFDPLFEKVFENEEAAIYRVRQE
ncbi:MAG: hypothetical protein IKP40_06475 [Clostridia bacterium]|nr:hypothetical protein [Clostridia bacterium]